jgi:hypothetical protein
MVAITMEDSNSDEQQCEMVKVVCYYWDNLY